jgi:nucleotide-binding universal stress UspA family protein
MARTRAGATVIVMTHPIAVAVAEEDEAQDAIALGLMAARTLGAPLVLTGVVVTVAPGGATVVPGWSSAADPSAHRDYVARHLHRLADEVPDDVPCTIRVETALSVVGGLERAVGAEDAQLLVVGASHLGPLARAARGDIGVGAARHAGCPVLIAHEGGGPDLERPPRRIVVGWDGGAAADGALELAARIAARAGADLELLHAVDGPPDGAVGRLHEAIARISESVPCRGAVHEGAPAGLLVDASGGCDLLVVGLERRAGLATLLPSSVSTAVLRHARCPVLVVPQGAPVPAPA